MKLKVGKKYLVRNDLIVGNYYGVILFQNGMKKHSGDIIELVELDSLHVIGRFDGYWYSPEMLNKYFPIETAPIGVYVLVWGSNTKTWSPKYFVDKEGLDHLIKNFNYTHWRPMPKGPK